MYSKRVPKFNLYPVTDLQQKWQLHHLDDAQDTEYSMFDKLNWWDRFLSNRMWSSSVSQSVSSFESQSKKIVGKTKTDRRLVANSTKSVVDLAREIRMWMCPETKLEQLNTTHKVVVFHLSPKRYLGSRAMCLGEKVRKNAGKLTAHKVNFAC